MKTNKNQPSFTRASRRTVMKGVLAGSLLTPFGLVHLRAQDSQMSNSSPLTSASHTQGISDSEIVLGTSAAFTGPSRGLGIELYRGAMAYFQHVNDNGGVHGRKVVLKLYDDTYNADPAVENTMKLMLDDQVFALFGYVGTPTVTRVLPLLKKFQEQEFVLFFPFTGAQPQRQPPYGPFAFNLRASYRQETAGLVDNFVSIGRKKIGVFYQADAYGRSGWAGVREALSKHHLKIVGEVTYKRGEKFTNSYEAQVERLNRDKPEAVICIGAYAACAGFLRDAVDGDLRVPIANLSFVGSENLLKLIVDSQEDSAQYSRYLVNSQVVPSYEDLSLAGIAQYDDFMQKYSPGLPAQWADSDYKTFDRSFVSLEGFLNAQLMTEILERIGPEPKRGKIEEAVFTIDNLDLGIGEMVSFNEARRQGLDKVYYTIVDRDKNVFVPLREGEWSKVF